MYQPHIVLRHCRSYLRKARGGFYAEVHHGQEAIFQVYADGTVLWLHPSQGLVQPGNVMGGKLLSHIRYQGRSLLRYHGVE